MKSGKINACFGGAYVKMRFFISGVRDKERLQRILAGVDYVVYAGVEVDFAPFSGNNANWLTIEQIRQLLAGLNLEK